MHSLIQATGTFGQCKSDIHCSKPSVFPRIFILERANRLARELDASAKRKTCLGRGVGTEENFSLRAHFAHSFSACANTGAVNSLQSNMECMIAANYKRKTKIEVTML